MMNQQPGQMSPFTLVPESNFGRTILLFMFIGGVFAVVVLWPWRLIIAIVILAMIFLYMAVRIYMLWTMHHVELEERRREISSLLPPPSAPRDELPSKVSPGAYQLPAVSFREVLDRGLVTSDGPYTMAFNAQGLPIQMERLTSLGIGGVPGMGKTVSTLVIMLQAIIKTEGRVRFLVVDPHMFSEVRDALVEKIRPLEKFFLTVPEILATVPEDEVDYRNYLKRKASLPNPLEGGAEMGSWLKIVEFEMEARLHGKKGDTWVIVADEFIKLLRDPRTASRITSVIESLNQNARKVGMFSLLISQQWKATALGGSADLRQSIPNFLLHQLPEAISSLIDPDAGRITPYLGQGQVVVYGGGVSEIGAVPLATREDAEMIASLYEPIKIEETIHLPKPTVRFDTPGEIPVVQIPEDFSKAELKLIQEQFGQGLSDADVAKTVYGVKAGPELAKAKIAVRKQLEWLVTREV